MALDTLIRKNIWDEYSQKVQDRMNNPRNMGEIKEEEAEKIGCELIVADFGAESCGDAVRLYWAVDPASDIIHKSKFKSFGCGTAVASSDTMAELCLGKTVDEAVKITNIDVEFTMRDNPETPAVPPQKMHCSVMAYDVIKKAAAQYKGVNPEDFEDEIIVCECARVSLGTIKEVIKINDLKTVEEITNYTKAGAFCKSCIKPGGHEDREYYLVDILKDVREEMTREEFEKEVKEVTTVQDKLEGKTVIQKLKIIEAVVEAEVSPYLQADGGNMEIMDIKENGEITELYIRYLGACHGCMSSTATLMGIEAQLQSTISENIRVFDI